VPQKDSPEKTVRDIPRKTRPKFSAESKIRIALEGLRGEESIASLCRREGIAANSKCVQGSTWKPGPTVDHSPSTSLLRWFPAVTKPTSRSL
jgi:hypothetical protein